MTSKNKRQVCVGVIIVTAALLSMGCQADMFEVQVHLDLGEGAPLSGIEVCAIRPIQVLPSWSSACGTTDGAGNTRLRVPRLQSGGSWRAVFKWQDQWQSLPFDQYMKEPLNYKLRITSGEDTYIDAMIVVTTQ